jgi:hypothetical protein
MMEAARTSETLVNFYQTTWRYNPEDSHLCKLTAMRTSNPTSIENVRTVPILFYIKNGGGGGEAGIMSITPQKICGSHGSEDVDCALLGCDAK